MSYHIEVENKQKSIRINSRSAAKTAQCILKYMRIKQASLSVVFMTDRTIHVMNRKFLGHDYPTDVIAFDLTDKELSRQKTKVSSIDGEIYISTVMARMNAKRFETQVHDEVMLYLIHGILHLLGYDDHGVDAKKKMRAKEKEILNYLKKDR